VPPPSCAYSCRSSGADWSGRPVSSERSIALERPLTRVVPPDVSVAQLPLASVDRQAGCSPPPVLSCPCESCGPRCPSLPPRRQSPHAPMIAPQLPSIAVSLARPAQLRGRYTFHESNLLHVRPACRAVCSHFLFPYNVNPVTNFRTDPKTSVCSTVSTSIASVISRSIRSRVAPVTRR